MAESELGMPRVQVRGNEGEPIGVEEAHQISTERIQENQG